MHRRHVEIAVVLVLLINAAHGFTTTTKRSFFKIPCPRRCIGSERHFLEVSKLAHRQGQIQNSRNSWIRNRLSVLKQRAKSVFERRGSVHSERTQNLEDSEVEARTRKWISKSVIGLNLCPFAERPMKNNDLHFQVVRGDDDVTVGKAVSAALYFTANESPGVTTVVIAPEYHPDDFERYITMVQFLEQRVMDDDVDKLSEKVQIAPFHPLFQLDNNNPEGAEEPIDVYSNRGPYPMFHIIRTDDVADAVDKLDGDPGKVWRRNQRLLQNLEQCFGRDTTVKILLGDENDDIIDSFTQKKLLNAVLKKTTLEMKEEENDGREKPLERGIWER